MSVPGAVVTPGLKSPVVEINSHNTALMQFRDNMSGTGWLLRCRLDEVMGEINRRSQNTTITGSAGRKLLWVGAQEWPSSALSA